MELWYNVNRKMKRAQQKNEADYWLKIYCPIAQASSLQFLELGLTRTEHINMLYQIIHAFMCPQIYDIWIYMNCCSSKAMTRP